jgi:ABC-2 type transport system permease protein
MRAVFRKEIAAFLSSIAGYVAIGAFLIACGLFLWVIPDTSILDEGYAGLDRFFELAPWLLLLLIPAVTMRSFADEFRSGTIEWLFTKPLRDVDIVLGKYFACLVLVGFALIPTLLYAVSVNALTAPRTVPDWGAITGSYIGLVFLAASFTAIGVFASSLTANQIVGFLVALFLCYLLYAGFEALSRVPAFAGGADYYLGLLGLSYHYENISRGVVDTRDIVYFISIIVLFLALTRVVLARRTWDLR